MAAIRRKMSTEEKKRGKNYPLLQAREWRGREGGREGVYRTRTLEKSDEKKGRRGGNNNNKICGSYSYSKTMSIGEGNGRLTVISCCPYSGCTLLM